MTHKVTILIPSIGRPKLIKFTFNSLKNQSFKDFEVIVILKSRDNETIKLAGRFKQHFDLQFLLQKHEGLLKAYEEGIENASGEIILFLDDDVIVDSNCIKEHVSMYEQHNISGVSGDVIPAYLINEKLKIIDNTSEITAFCGETQKRMAYDKLCDTPLEGQEKHLVYLSKAGYFKTKKSFRCQNIVDSLLCMAANMSAQRNVLRDIRLPVFLEHGINFEQIIGWRLWKKGYRTVFNPKAKVYHIRHGQSMSRFLDLKNTYLAKIEDELIFYYLILEGEKLSKMHRIAVLIYNIMTHIIKMKQDWKYQIVILKGIFAGNLTGLKWLVSKKRFNL
ncbi:MAG: glycosyltransferase [Candidatus Bathyarchaeia archaeon]